MWLAGTANSYKLCQIHIKSYAASIFHLIYFYSVMVISIYRLRNTAITMPVAKAGKMPYKMPSTVATSLLIRAVEM